MKLSRLFLAEPYDSGPEKIPANSIPRRFERSPIGNLLFAWICATFFAPLILLYYDWINGHHAASMYVAHIWVHLIKPIQALLTLLSWIWELQ